MKMFAVHDLKAESFGSVLFFRTKGEAIRSFTDEVNRPESQVGKYASDYTLYALGEYDQSSGRVTGLNPVEPVVSAIECLNSGS